MNLSHISVDGSLRNPYMLAAFLTWSLFLLLLAASVGLAARRYRHHLPLRATLLVLFTVAAPVAVRVIGSFFYAATAQRLFGVGFWGGPPFWSFLAVAVAGVLSGWFMRASAAA